MNPVLRNILAVIVGVFAGGFLNMGIIMVSASIIPPPAGADVTTIEGLKASLHLFEPKNFLMPFLAHALGTLTGAFITAKLVTAHRMKFALGVGSWYFLGGLINIFMLPSPIWFTIVDLGLAYFPMAYLAGRLAFERNPGN
ncbi:MAG: hypothetical protein K0R26_1358 [Bacteroidota bacterium]|jgi:hypothetical protein|nr:hypothetical protein [Bacteroidota bacterium]